MRYDIVAVLSDAETLSSRSGLNGGKECPSPGFCILETWELIGRFLQNLWLGAAINKTDELDLVQHRTIAGSRSAFHKSLWHRKRDGDRASSRHVPYPAAATRRDADLYPSRGKKKRGTASAAPRW